MTPTLQQVIDALTPLFQDPTAPPAQPPGPAPKLGIILPPPIAGRSMVTTPMLWANMRIFSKGFTSANVWRIPFVTPAVMPVWTSPATFAGGEWIDLKARRFFMLLKDSDSSVVYEADGPGYVSDQVSVSVAATAPPRSGRVALLPATAYSLLVWDANSTPLLSTNMFMDLTGVP